MVLGPAPDPAAGAGARPDRAEAGQRARPRLPLPASGDGTWTGLDGYYVGETLRLVPAADGIAQHLDLGTFVFTREPYGPGAPRAARPHPDGWQG